MEREQDSTKESMVEAFRQHGTIQSYKKNEYIFQENDAPSGAYYVEAGLIKISQSSEEGQGITLFLRYEGEIFGNAEILTQMPRKRYARCLVDSQIITLDSRKFLELAKENAEFAYSLAVLGARRLLQTQKMVETLICRPVAWRLAWFLMQLGKPTNEQLEINVPLSHEEISYVIGCSRQTVTETLNKWRDQALIDYSKKKIVIYRPNQFFTQV
ncbi:cAMP-activated global transcriptional regulator CRP [Paenibacillus marchantiophytorum]|uniref:cAMP-activated global transcriptional regulator CRP n=1 Tax=Paenibacillus marchantiophytorum TaxID=1619310 RepID=A0ABQ2BT81_9BACL|nr:MULTISPECIES: Crp/Fnr family transcriptional regulator [Paenibacillus]UKS24275.1 Crp/Fnr family transcriptional regulator [Paenibacillus sp. HWE-109]GGI44431.1 cAMP-activated global transcriptional regulator CRP [Paenibacillus marchantiophytorum]